MQYALLVYLTPADRERMREDAPAQAEIDAGYTAFTRALVEAGVLRSGQRLALPDVATTLVAQPDGRPLVQDGPFADTKEQLGGFFVIEVDDLDAAIRWGSRCPAARLGRLEIRPIIAPPT